MLRMEHSTARADRTRHPGRGLPGLFLRGLPRRRLAGEESDVIDGVGLAFFNFLAQPLFFVSFECRLVVLGGTGETRSPVLPRVGEDNEVREVAVCMIHLAGRLIRQSEVRV